MVLLVASLSAHAQQIYKFERIGVVDGLSQNFVQSILCDNKGFLWFGTWDGLNRYDGLEFKIYKVNPNQENSLTSNRIIDLWQDKLNTLWIKTNDGYIHYFIDETYEFITFPNYLNSLNEPNNTINCFEESNQQEVFLGSSNSGLYYLSYNEETGRYREQHFLSQGLGTISNNDISFINIDQSNIWIGTKNGLNAISREELSKDSPSFTNYWLDHKFTVSYKLDSILLFGTDKTGIKTYNYRSGELDSHPIVFKDLEYKSITVLSSISKNKLLIGTQDTGLYIYDLENGQIESQFLTGKTVRKIYSDSYETIWINTDEFGIYQIDKELSKIRHFEFTDENIKSLVDDERQNLFEDSNRNLWIALHGSGLARYDRNTESFYFYQNQPDDNSTISSDNVYCITEDQSGMLWVGTGIPSGGINKVYTSNEAFQQVILEDNIISGNENLVRSILIDNNEHIWLGTKAGVIYILDPKYNILRKIDHIALVSGTSPGQNAYTMIQDKDGFVWIGTKGGGVFVTELSMNNPGFNYQNLKFFNYKNDPDDQNSLNSNLIYSIVQDTYRRIWIGSYQRGLNLITSRNRDKLQCKRYNTANSEISSDKIRHLLEDRSQRLWITTAFGVNYIDLKQNNLDELEFNSILFDPSKSNSLSYNDVVHAYQDTNNDLWFGTYGGGVNRLLTEDSGSFSFEHINTSNGLINDAVFAITEDPVGRLWFSTDHGITRYNPIANTFENFDQSSNLPTDIFNENTCEITEDGRLLFGTNQGLLVVYPDRIQKNNFVPNVVLTNFQLFNKDVDITDPDSPIKQDIETLNKLVLKHFQSSFSIQYAALSYFSPSKNKYAFKLDNFDEEWNEVGNQNKATYTNLLPGEYKFSVKAANWNGDWSNKTRSISITILPPWWKTTTMYFVFAVIFIIIFESIRRAYLRYHKLQNDLKVEKRVNDIKLQFFTNISHEIRTPLTLILGPIHDLTELKNIPVKILNKLHLVEKNGKRMLRLVNQLLDFRKIERNKMTLKVHRIELISFIRSIIENFDLITEHKNLKIKFKPRVHSLDVWVDPNKFDAVIFNILSNALKFSPPSTEVSISVDASTEEHIDISIRDQGYGIPKDRLNLIFQRFTPITEKSEEFGSSGIGLAFSYQIMKLHHGDLLVQSEHKKGSIFTIRLLSGLEHFLEEEIWHDEVESLYKIKHEKIIEDDGELLQIPENKPNKKENHILIVEDNLHILHYLRESLQHDYDISTVTNGKEALDYINTKHPDILITDIMMPEMNGIELTQHLKESIKTSHIPVIMLTAKSSMENQIEGIKCGAEAYILKPFNMAYVRAVISGLIQQRSIIQMKYIQNKHNGNLDLKITSKDEKFLKDITQLIMDNYSDPEFNIEKLVESSYVSRTAFYHKIKSLTGLTPIDFLRQKRLQIAAQMMLETDCNVSEIAVITGFNDIKNFSKRFKEIYKLTPTQYKQEKLRKINSEIDEH